MILNIFRHLLKYKIIGQCEKQIMKNVEKYSTQSDKNIYHDFELKLHPKCNLIFDLFSFYEVFLLNGVEKSILNAHPHTFLDVFMYQCLFPV